MLPFRSDLCFTLLLMCVWRWWACVICSSWAQNSPLPHFSYPCFSCKKRGGSLMQALRAAGQMSDELERGTEKNLMLDWIEPVQSGREFLFLILVPFSTLRWRNSCPVSFAMVQRDLTAHQLGSSAPENAHGRMCCYGHMLGSFPRGTVESGGLGGCGVLKTLYFKFKAVFGFGWDAEWKN